VDGNRAGTGGRWGETIAFVLSRGATTTRMTRPLLVIVMYWGALGLVGANAMAPGVLVVRAFVLSRLVFTTMFVGTALV
jgi:hypothetical protein